jgi:hypothetical protein
MDMPMSSGKPFKNRNHHRGAATKALDPGTETSLGETNHRTGDVRVAGGAGSGHQ